MNIDEMAKEVGIDEKRFEVIKAGVVALHNFMAKQLGFEDPDAVDNFATTEDLVSWITVARIWAQLLEDHLIVQFREHEERMIH